MVSLVLLLFERRECFATVDDVSVEAAAPAVAVESLDFLWRWCVDVEFEVELVALVVDWACGGAAALCISKPAVHANRVRDLIENNELDFFMGDPPLWLPSE